ncbi:transketolase, partial [Tremellales sp. Uapishka_1]
MTIILNEPFVAEPDDVLAINNIRLLAADIIAKSASGHPGAPLGMAPAAHVLFTKIMKANPKNSSWWNRDRFVLSNGHACVLYYILLHLMGYDVTMDDLKSYRQLDSRTPGHPERGVTDGIEVTTGPLGQGFANSVGLAIAQAHLASTFNKDGFPIFDNHTYMYTGDGCLQEGVASEAASLAGHLRLGNLIALWDDNRITVDGNTKSSFTEDVPQRFEAYGWQVLHVEEGNTDLAGIFAAIQQAKKNTTQPTLIRVHTLIGCGSRLEGQGSTHGAPLKPDDIAGMKTKWGFDVDSKFVVADGTRAVYNAATLAGEAANDEWDQLFAAYKTKYPEDATELSRRMEGRLPEGWEDKLPSWKPSDPAIASRKMSEEVLDCLATAVPELVGGSADLTPANLTRWTTAIDFQSPASDIGERKGRYIRYGVREHAMYAICNGLAAYGGIIPFNATFLNFVGYAAGAARLSALSHLGVINVTTHDCIGLGEDGPTHQSIETAPWLRAMPNMKFWRPADGNETVAAYVDSIRDRTHPSTLTFSRQDLPHLAASSVQKALKGGYVALNVETPDIILVSTGSELSLTIQAADILAREGIKARVVSLPCWEVFENNDLDYKLSVLPSGAPIMSIEAYSTFGWQAYSHEQLGMLGYGASAPYQQLYEKFGLTPAAIATRAGKILKIYQDRGIKPVSPLLSATRELLRLGGP